MTMITRMRRLFHRRRKPQGQYAWRSTSPARDTDAANWQALILDL